MPKSISTKTPAKQKRDTAQFVIDWEITQLPDKNVTALELFSLYKSLRRVLLYTSEAKRLGEDLATGKPKVRRGNMRQRSTPSKPK